MQRSLLFLLLFFFALVACKKQGEAPPESFDQYAAEHPNSQAALYGFVFEAALNGGLSQDANGIIGDGAISVSLPQDLALDGLKPSFRFAGKRVLVGGVEQTSGETTQDFAEAVTYRVEAYDGTTQDYPVSVTTYDPDDPLLASGENGISLDGGANWTKNRQVAVSLVAQSEVGITGYYLSESQGTPALDDEGWTLFNPVERFAATTTFTLSNSYSIKTVYAWFQDNQGNLLGPAKDLIRYSLYQQPIPDTGQTTCHNNSTTITCPTAGQAFYGQDAQYNNTNQPNYTNNGDGTVTDNVTGLIWQRCSAGLSGANCGAGAATTHTWESAGSYCADNTAGLPGNNWRLPTKIELSWIVRNEGSAPFINQSAFPNTKSTYYWTSTSYANNTSGAWYVNFAAGNVDNWGKSGKFHVRCVH